VLFADRGAVEVVEASGGRCRVRQQGRSGSVRFQGLGAVGGRGRAGDSAEISSQIIGHLDVQGGEGVLELREVFGWRRSHPGATWSTPLRVLRV